LCVGIPKPWKRADFLFGEGKAALGYLFEMEYLIFVMFPREAFIL
jgi:hypothetical protein